MNIPSRGRPEDRARANIDRLLVGAGWSIQNRDSVNIDAARGIAIREFLLAPGYGFADYLLYVDGYAAGVVEAKKEGIPLTEVELKTDRYSAGLPPTLPAPRRPLPFCYQSTGIETRFTNLLEPDARSRPVFGFHRPEQRRIVAEIEKQFSLLDTGLLAADRAAKRARTYRRAISHSALENVRQPQCADATVADVAELIQYGTSEKCSEDPSGVAVLRMGNITADGALSADKLKYLPETCPEIPKLLLKPGDLLFNRTNSAELVGKSAVYTGSPSPCSFASYLIRVRFKPTCLPGFVALCLNSDYGRSWVSTVASQQVGQANVSGSKLARFRFPLPSVEAQRIIMDKVGAQLSALDVLELTIALTRGRAARLRQSILKAAFEGKLVPQNPNDEPASVLLERIRASRAHALPGAHVRYAKKRKATV